MTHLAARQIIAVTATGHRDRRPGRAHCTARRDRETGQQQLLGPGNSEQVHDSGKDKDSGVTNSTCPQRGKEWSRENNQQLMGGPG